ncbi:hypothetical protein A3B36_02080 [Candidatus Uhrbacteria bacterium RIFCSPLOWO2_01_FULL_55_36]|uniref:Uncharacterized protein n=1 Tax=Candidatus Uhrbacteria bacterium RIFCSPLOWO2_01_FULL_55_36 TaxID=1802404 RepID=A0A1F7V1Y0_9BACT|nr:MAG: hypothetical protein A3B36_02080 [Candidatus Uhrbacteria bacterium RIFCSPLOWO2_01_FULL_55_36]
MPSPSKLTSRQKKILDALAPDEALEFLRKLAREDPALAARVERMVGARLEKVDCEKIAKEVLGTLEAIDVHDVWDNAGSTSYGYVEPNELAVQMFEEAMEPCQEEMKRYHTLKLSEQAREYCKGILKGIHLFSTISTSEYKNWADDAPGETFRFILDEWKKTARVSDAKDMDEFVMRECADWRG